MRTRYMAMTCCFVVLVVAVQAAPPPKSEPAPSALPPWSTVQRVLTGSLFAQPGREPRDLVDRSEVGQLFSELEKIHWQVADRQQILERVLPESHVLVTTFRTPAGSRFMRKIAGRNLMYDRLDRISEVSGGSRLIQDIVRLPDGERYAKPSSGGGVPDLLDLLPKGPSGKTRRIADYDRPTERIYTSEDLMEVLAEQYQAAVEAQQK